MDVVGGRRSAHPAISLVVSTIGRPGPLHRLLMSLLPAADRVEVVVVDQSNDGSCLPVIRDFADVLRCRGTTSPRGASTGRNAGADLASAPLLAFPDDNCWYRPDTVPAILGHLRPVDDAICGMQVTSEGRPSMIRWPAHPTEVTRRNVHRTGIESTIVIRSRVFRSVGGFDPSLGVGSQSPYQSGEATDLLLRLLAAGFRVQYQPAVKVVQDDPAADPEPSYVPKMTGYGRGFGRIYRLHGLSRAHLLYALSRKVVASAVHSAAGQTIRGKADLAFARAAVEGFRDPL